MDKEHIINIFPFSHIQSPMIGGFSSHFIHKKPPQSAVPAQAMVDQLKELVQGLGWTNPFPLMALTPQMLGVIGGQQMMTWGWVNTYRYIFSGMNIHLPAILGFTRYQGFDPSPTDDDLMLPEATTKNDAGSGAQEAAAPTQAGSHP